MVFLLCLNRLTSSLKDEKLVVKGDVKETKGRFPVTYIVSSKDNLTVLTTVSTEDEWTEYVKTHNINSVFMDFREPRDQTLARNDMIEDADITLRVRQGLSSTAPIVLPKVETYEEHYITKQNDHVSEVDNILFGNDELTKLENTRRVKSVDNNTTNKTSPEDWLEQFYSEEIVSKKKDALSTENPLQSVITEAKDTISSTEFQIIANLPESDFNLIKIFDPERNSTEMEMLFRLTQSSEEGEVVESEDERDKITLKKEADKTKYIIDVQNADSNSTMIGHLDNIVLKINNTEGDKITETDQNLKENEELVNNINVKLMLESNTDVLDKVDDLLEQVIFQNSETDNSENISLESSYENEEEEEEDTIAETDQNIKENEESIRLMLENNTDVFDNVYALLEQVNFPHAETENISLESPFENDFKELPDFGLSLKGPKQRIRSMMLKILQQDPELFESKTDENLKKYVRYGRELEMMIPASTNQVDTTFKVPENFRTYLRISPQWIKSNYW